MQHSTHSWMARILTFGLAGVFAFGLAVPSMAFADDASGTSQEASTAVSEMNALQAQVDEASNDLVVAQQAEADAQAKMDEAQAQIATNTAKISRLQDQLSTRARSMYRNGNSSMLDVLMGATSFSDFITNWDLLDKMNADDAQMVQESKDAKIQLEEATTTYEQQKQEAVEQQQLAAQSKSQAESSLSSRQAVYNNLSDGARTEVDATYEGANSAAASAAADAGMTDDGYSGYPENGGTSSGGAAIGGGASEMARAAACIGVPYNYGSDGSDGFFDCSGFVSYCLTGSFGHAYTTGTLMGYPAVDSPQVGDIVVCSYHCGIWVGDGIMIDASNDGVGYHSYTNGWYMGSDYKIVRV